MRYHIIPHGENHQHDYACECKPFEYFTDGDVVYLHRSLTKRHVSLMEQLTVYRQMKRMNEQMNRVYLN